MTRYNEDKNFKMSIKNKKKRWPLYDGRFFFNEKKL